MPDAYGASQEAWHHWSVTLGLAEHLLPVVANPGATISPDSHMQLLGKTPSRYNLRKQVSGFLKWTEHRATRSEINKWEQEADYGICVQSREGSLRAIDIDVPGVNASRAILETITAALPLHFFTPRSRQGTGKVLLPFRYEGELPKHMLQVDGGVVEILGDGQQWIADSSYLVLDTANKTNAKQRVNGRYEWPAGWPKSFADVPLLTPAELADLRDTLEMLHGTSAWQIARKRRDKPIDTGPRPGSNDEVADWLLEKWDVRDEGRSGELFIRCPFDAEHTTDSGPTETVYYPAGTGGYERGHFKCLHAHCLTRSDDDYLGAVGFVHDLSDAPEIAVEEGEHGDVVGGGALAPRAEGPAPRYLIDKQGRKENRAYNHKLFIQSPESGVRLAYDAFTDRTVWCPPSDPAGAEKWREFKDEHYTRIVRQMDRNGFVPQASSAIRDAVRDEAKSNTIDTAIAWANRLPEWDGVERVARFLPGYLEADDTEYAQAVGVYIWTALAGRVLQPGCKADMTPVLVGPQGYRKSTAIEVLVPHDSMYVEIDLSHRDEETARKLRGKLAAELNELKGLRGRDAEAIKAFMVRKVEEWTPKYLEYNTSFRRRCLFFGTTNAEEGFLNDQSGERRWLPFEVRAMIDTDRIAADREQLWAEGVARFRDSGVAWQEAERLARGEHHKFKEHDDWAQAVRQWLLLDDPLGGGAPVDRPYTWTAADVLAGALAMRMKEFKLGDKMRMGRVLTQLGCTKKRVRQGTHLEWTYAIEKDQLL